MSSVATPAIERPAEHHLAARAQHAGERAQRRGLAGAVGAEQRRDAALVDLEVEPVQRLQAAVIGAEPAHRKQRLAHFGVPPR